VSTVARFVIRDGPHQVVIPIETLDYAMAHRGGSMLKAGKTKCRMARTLTALAASLPVGFLRVHRSAVVNLDRVRRVELCAGTAHVAILSDGSRVRVSRRHYRRLCVSLEEGE